MHAGVTTLLMASVLGAVFAASSKLKDPGDFFMLCKRSDPDLGGCVRRSIEKARPLITKGIPEMNLPPLDPLFIPYMESIEGSGRSQFRQVLKNVTLYGLKSHQIQESKVPSDLSRMYLSMVTPVISFDALYEISGKILALPISGNGICKFTFNNVKTVADVPMKREQRDGKEYLRADVFRWTIEAESGTVHFENLFNGDPKLGEAMNKFLNENWKEAFDAYKHLPEDAMGELFTQIFNRVLTRFPVDVLFSE